MASRLFKNYKDLISTLFIHLLLQQNQSSRAYFKNNSFCDVLFAVDTY